MPSVRSTTARNLTEADYAALARSWITREIADAAGLYRVSSLDGRDLLGRTGPGDYAGIVFPNRWPGETHSRLDRLRLDNPPVDASTGKPKHKYLTAYGSGNRLYLPPCDPALLADVSLPIVTTEGEKKTLALWRAALESGNGTGRPAFLPVGLTGVWGWKGRIGTVVNAEGKRVPEKGVIPDMDRLAWAQRKATILFDADVTTNDQVRYARRDLARHLAGREAEVFLADLPASEGVNGVDDFLARFGLAQTLDILKGAAPYDWYEALIWGDKGGILAMLANAITALRLAPEWCGVLACNEFAMTVTTLKPTPWGEVKKWTEQDDRLLANWLQHKRIFVSDSEAAKAVETVARDRSWHPVREWLESLRWDGTGRIDDWLTLYLGAEPSDLTRAIGARWLLSAVARIYEPGCQADHVLILEGPQGAFKSTAIGILGQPWYSDDMADLGTKDASLGTIGVWIIELSELDAMTRAEVSKVKSFVSRRTDRFRPPYGRRMIESPRQCVFAGTVNNTEYLRDETGGRRFWPVVCGRIDRDLLRRDRDKLWAEAVVRYRKGEQWWLADEKLIEEAEQEQENRYQRDAWEEPIEAYIEGRRGTGVTVAECLKEPLEKPIGMWTRGDETRVGSILRRLKWKPKGAARPRVYRPPANQPNHPT